MTTIIATTNDGQAIVSSTYWQTEHAVAGKLYCSINAGAVRVLLPRAHRHIPDELRTARHAVLSRGPWPEAGGADAVEIMWDDGTADPYALHLSVESFDLLPAEPEWSRAWVVTTWDEDRDGRPRKRTEHVCHWRRVPRIPWMRAWES